MDEAEALRKGGGGDGDGAYRPQGAVGGRRERLRKSERLWVIVACVAIAAATIIGICFAVYANQTGAELPAVCGSGNVGGTGDVASGSEASKRANELFRGLDASEFQSVVDFLLRREDLNLTRSSKATLNSNYIYMVEHHLPAKSDILSHLDASDGRQGAGAVKRAKAVLFMGAASPKYVAEYLVSPVPNPIGVEPMTRASSGRGRGRGNSTRMPWHARPVCATVEGHAARRFLDDEVGDRLRHLLNDSFGQWLGGGCELHRACLYPMIAARAKPGSDERRLFCDFYRDRSSVEGNYLYPVAFQVLLRTPGNGDVFTVEYVYYGNRRFDSLDSLLQAYESGGVPRVGPPPPLSTLSGRYTSPRRRGGGDDERSEAPRPPPSQFSPGGRRFTVDGRRVEYLGWSFDLYFRTVSGLELFDVRYRGEPVAFELGMQDIVVTYGGTEPHNMFKTFFDAGYSLGTLSYPLVRGADCPAGAAYVDSVVYALGSDGAVVMRDAACVFEHVNSVPVRRHYSSDAPRFNYAFSMPDSVLVVRQIVTVWNYDYVFDYEFHQNGVVDVRVSSSGYVVVTNTHDSRYGFRLSELADTLANVHGHYFHFKLDVDAVDRQNSATYVDVQLESTSNPLVAGNYSQLRIVPRRVATETDSLVRYDFARPKYCVIHSERRKNALGQSRGYRIHSSSFADVMLPLDNPQMAGASWARHQLAITKQKDTERGTASIYTQGDPSEPVVDFRSFYEDDEPIVDEDIVAWVTLGMHHVPCAEDLPVTTTPGRSLVVSLIPFNFFDEDPSIGSRDAAVFVRGESGEPNALPYIDPVERCITPRSNVSVVGP